MTAWILTLGLQNLRKQVNQEFPYRDRVSDGTIGDAAHQKELSGHNPDDTTGSKAAWNKDPDSVPEVRAWDMDSDLTMHGVTAQQVVDHIRRLPGLTGVIRYMIYNKTMYHMRDSYNPTPYTGASAHTEHVHFEGAWSQAGDNNTSFNYRLEELTMPLPEDYAKAVWTYPIANPYNDDKTQAAGGLVAFVGSRQGISEEVAAQIAPEFEAVNSELALIKTALANIENKLGL